LVKGEKRGRENQSSGEEKDAQKEKILPLNESRVAEYFHKITERNWRKENPE